MEDNTNNLMQNGSNNAFENLDWGTVPTSVKTEIIEVQIDPKLMVKDFAEAYAKELYRRNPLRAKEVNLTSAELYSYFTGILKTRVDSVNEECKYWRQAKQLLVPTWVQFVISRIGLVRDTQRGLIIKPVLDVKVDIKQLLDVSNRLELFLEDGVALHKQAFPTVPEGDVDTMSMSLINDYVYGQSKVPAVNSYIAAFLGFTLKRNTNFEILYRVRYDDVDFIRDMLINTKELL